MLLLRALMEIGSVFYVYMLCELMEDNAFLKKTRVRQ